MTREEFDALIKRLEESSRLRPRRYRFQVAALAAVGYSYIFVVLVAMLALTGLLIALIVFYPNGVTIKVGLVLGAITGGVSLAILKALWIRVPPPDGMPVKRPQAPALFALLDELSLKLRAPRLHHVLIVDEYNAAISQVPRLGVFGLQRNYLLVGLPLMQSLSSQEFRAVMAHEFAHLSGNHSRFNAWVYRVRRTWQRIFEEMNKRQQKGTALLTIFINWFWPKFDAHAFVLARANEYEADACSAELAGAAATADALMRVNLHAAFLQERFWPSILKQANLQALPPPNVFADMAEGLLQALPADDRARWLRTMFLLETDNLDTHPSLRDRLSALGQLPEMPAETFAELAPPTPVTAAQAMLGEAEPIFTERASERWRQRVEPGWKQRNEHTAELRQQLARLEEHAATRDAEILWTKARALLDLEGSTAALPVVLEVLELVPDHPSANLIRGLQALAEDDALGVEFIKRAMANDATLTIDGCRELYAFYKRTGQHEKIPELDTQVYVYKELQARDAAERNVVTPEDTFIAHELPAAEVARLCEVFAAERDVFKVEIARKLMVTFPQMPLYVISMSMHRSWWKIRATAANNRLIHRLEPNIKLDYFYLFVSVRKLKSLGDRIAAAPDAQIFRRAR